MLKNKPAIVVVAFNRPRSLSRLLVSIANASYTANDISLIISIDKSETNDEVLKIADTFEWKFGFKEVRYNKVNLGLRKHILKCGDISQEYSSIILLEDDLYVSPIFYQYAQEALEFSNNKDQIGGISLYNHQLNMHNRENFSPFEDGYDNWYFQFASSWGQAWSNIQWIKFKEWYEINQILPINDDIPFNVSSWSEKSWLKFYIIYLIKEKKFFLYPKVSLSTNFSDAGTHVGMDSTSLQVPLAFHKREPYNFSTIKESQAVYNAFYENQELHKYLKLSEDEICIDLYANKTNNTKRYWLTTAKLDFVVLKSFGRSLKPIDINIIKQISGNEIFLYDTSKKKKNQRRLNLHRKLIYNIKHISLASALKASYFIFKDRIKNKIK